MSELKRTTRENVGATRADAGRLMRRAGERSRPGSREQELGLAIARVLQDRDLRLKLEACTMRIGDGKGTLISAVEMLSQRADQNPDGRSLIGAVTRVLSEEMLMLTLSMYRSGENGTSRSAADVLRGYGINPSNWELGRGNIDVRTAPPCAPPAEECRGWGLCTGHI
ncbi:MAG: hypothetical protein PHQ80_02710 [Candidatus ainarchaeum sp.]|nr:hypothetical protein [Candidatus ainarchaeum sp.]MDD5096240.1 hypothetical protein [Candidatus ainarchaeum sp.]